jgi:predicted dehydrogenase
MRTGDGSVLRTFIVGLGRAGGDLHLPVLRRLRASGSGPWERDAPIFGYDPALAPDAFAEDQLKLVGSLHRARSLLDPETTVVHLCTPPVVRLEVLHELAEMGFQQILMEKPMTADPAELGEMLRLRTKFELRLQVVAPWLASMLTQRIESLVQSGRLGDLRSIAILQRKPRMQKTAKSDGHPSVFDVEVPHSVGLALRLAGDGDIEDAACTDMRIGDRVFPRMGTGRLRLRHHCGVETSIFSDLTAPLRERRITVDFENGRLVGYYPAGRDDHYAHLRLVEFGGGGSAKVLEDDGLGLFLRAAYQKYAGHADLWPDLELNVRVVQLIGDAKDFWALADKDFELTGVPENAC